ncbi:MAG: siroheme synthase CysG [Proteobacteria bacterium]|nr:siroheme synthase CysG [Pseudomonadota bacterium]
MDYLPVFLNIKNQNCLVLGGDETAESKISLLLRAGAKVTVIAPSLKESLSVLATNGEFTHHARAFTPEDFDGKRIVIVADEDDTIRKEATAITTEKNIPVNVVDCPELCTFTMPSIIDRSPVLIAVSTGGASPTLARLIRAKLEAMLPQAYGRLATLISEFRIKAKELNRDREEKRKFWNKIFSSPIIDLFLSGKERQAKEEIQKEFESRETRKASTGQVCLVGAGPGDPDLLTLRALRLIQNADTIVYDRLVFPSILDYARRDAELIYVGKKSALHTVPQDQINQKLVDLAREGKMVVRLKGGDPFIFGRGGEEVEELIKEGISYQVVPGVTAASGCSTYAGIPLTHRDYAQSCTLVTGHLKDGSMDLNWGCLTRTNQTIVFYMGVANIERVTSGLVQHGMKPDMPAAVVQKGTTKNQKVFTGTVTTISDVVRQNDVKPPSLIIIGEVVNLHKKLGGSALDRIIADH